MIHNDIFSASSSFLISKCFGFHTFVNSNMCSVIVVDICSAWSPHVTCNYLFHEQTRLPVCTEKNAIWHWSWIILQFKIFLIKVESENVRRQFFAAFFIWNNKYCPCFHSYFFVVFLFWTMTSENEDNRLRFRRTQSVTRAEEITNNEQKQRKSQPDKPWVYFYQLILCGGTLFEYFDLLHVVEIQMNGSDAGALTESDLKNIKLWMNVTQLMLQ